MLLVKLKAISVQHFFLCFHICSMIPIKCHHAVKKLYSQMFMDLKLNIIDYAIQEKEIGVSFWKEDDELTFELTELHSVSGSAH